METFSALLALCAGNSPVTGELLSQRPVTRSFDVFFDLCLNKRLSKQSWGWWFETPSRSLWRHCNEWHAGNPAALLLYYEWFFYVFCLINWPLGDTTVIWLVIFKLNPRTDIFSISCVIALRWTPKTSVMICQHWLMWLLGVVRHQAITWSNIDQVLWHHMSSLDDNESNQF